MKQKMRGSFYPHCSSVRRTFRKNEDISGIFSIQSGYLVFEAKLFQCIPLKSRSFKIPLKNIEEVETMNLNGIMPFGVCLFMKDNSEYMLGHMHNKKLANWIKMAIK